MRLGMEPDPWGKRGMSRITVFLADWQVLFREGVHFTLSGEEDIDVIGEATSSEEALKAIQAHPPRVAVLNADHEDSAGIRVTRYLRQNLPSVAVVLMIDSKDEEHLFQSMKSGASACLTKEVDPVDMIDTIRLVAQGKQPVAEAMLLPGIATRVLRDFDQFTALSAQVGGLLPTLTNAETEVLRRTAQEGSIQQIVQALSMSREDIGEHLQRILTKLATNDYIRQVMAAAPSTTRLDDPSQTHPGRKPAEEYITRDEFAAFRDNIWERFRTAIDDIK